MVNPRFKSDELRFEYINKWIKGKDILDIGSSEGHVNKLLVKNNPSRKIYTLDLDSKADFKMDLDKPKKISKKFDTIIAGEIIEHVISPIGLVRYCKSLLKRGGRLIITTPNATGIQYLLKPNWCVYYKDYRGHTQAFTIPMLERVCKDEKMKILNSDYINAFWINNPLQYISWMIKRLRPDLIVVAENI